MNRKLIPIILFFFFLLILQPLMKTQAGSREFNIKLKETIEISEEVNGIAINQNNEILIGTDNNIYLFSYNFNELIEENSVQRPAEFLIWDPSGTRFYDGRYISDGDTLDKMDAHEAKYGIWSPNGELFLMNNGDKITLWDAQDWIILKQWDNDFSSRPGLAWIDDRYYIGATRYVITIMDTQSDLVYDSFLIPELEGREKPRLSLDTDNKLMIYAEGASTARIYNYVTSEFQQSIFGHENGVVDAVFSPISKNIMSCGGDGSVRIWKSPDYLEKDVTTIHTGNEITECKWSEDERYIILDKRENVEIWEITGYGLVANAGPDRTIPKGPALLDGTNSVGLILDDDYKWEVFFNDVLINTLHGRMVESGFNIVGIYTARLTVTDGISEDMDEAIITVVIPSDRPSVNITSHASKDTVSGTITIEGDASDDIELKAVYIRINYGPWQVCNGLESWEYSIDTTKYINGTYTISAISNDGYFQSDEDSIDINFQNEQPTEGKPIITIITPTDGSEVKGSVWINGTSMDDSFVEAIVIFYGKDGTFHGITSYGTRKWFASWDTCKIEDGWWTIKANSVDDMNLKSDEHVISVYVNNTDKPRDEIPPTINIENPINGSILDGFITVFGTAYDSNDLVIIQVSFNGYYWYEADGKNNWTYTIDSKRFPNEKCTLQARAYDGRWFGVDSIEIFINNSVERDNENEDSALPFTFYPLLLVVYIISIALFGIGVIKERLYNKRRNRYTCFYQLIGLIVSVSILLFMSIIPDRPYHTNLNNDDGYSYNEPDKGTVAPDFTIQTMDGAIITNERSIEKIVVIHFMMVLPPYRPDKIDYEVRGLSEVLSKDYGPDVVVISLESVGAINDFMLRGIFNRSGGDWYFNFDYDHRIREGFELEFIKVAIIGKDGAILFTDDYFDTIDISSVLDENI